MRILHLASSHRWTGAAEPVAALAREQLALGHDVRVACVEGGSFWKRVKRRFGVPRRHGLDLRPGFHPLAAARDLGVLRDLARECDVIHCHLQHDHWLAAIALRLIPGFGGRAPALIRTFHRDVPPRSDFAHRWLYARATDALIVVSRSARAAAMEALAVGEGRVFHVHGAVDLDPFHPGLDPAPVRAEFAIAPAAPAAGIVARMQPHRGHNELIDAFEEIAAKVPEAVCVISGRGEMKKPIRARIEAHPLRERIKNIGFRKDDLPETYAALDVSVLLAQGSDGTCRAMLEAMACARPVIGVNVGAIADTIEPGKTGWLVPPGDRAALAAAMADALSDRARLAQMGAAARRRMEESFTQRARAEATTRVYEQALSRRG